jgi:hypothetical protein
MVTDRYQAPAAPRHRRRASRRTCHERGPAVSRHRQPARARPISRRWRCPARCASCSGRRGRALGRRARRATAPSRSRSSARPVDQRLRGRGDRDARLDPRVRRPLHEAAMARLTHKRRGGQPPRPRVADDRVVVSDVPGDLVAVGPPVRLVRLHPAPAPADRLRVQRLPARVVPETGRCRWARQACAVEHGVFSAVLDRQRASASGSLPDGRNGVLDVGSLASSVALGG